MAKPTPTGARCAACFAAEQSLEAGDFADDSEIIDLLEEQALGGDAVVIFRGEGLCEIHFNRKRGYPADYPKTPLPGVIRKNLRERYAEALGFDFDEDTESSARPRMKTAKGSRRRG